MSRKKKIAIEIEYTGEKNIHLQTKGRGEITLPEMVVCSALLADGVRDQGYSKEEVLNMLSMVLEEWDEKSAD